jgi:hypothetical protein
VQVRLSLHLHEFPLKSYDYTRCLWKFLDNYHLFHELFQHVHKHIVMLLDIFANHINIV